MAEEEVEASRRRAIDLALVGAVRRSEVAARRPVMTANDVVECDVMEQRKVQQIDQKLSF